MTPSNHTGEEIASRLLAWYDSHHRDLPWRAAPGNPANPYHVWISEIMLQQTTVAAVQNYFTRFIARFPTLTALAAASQDEVLTLWAGLGYYSRGRNLHKAAGVIQARFNGQIPADYTTLKTLPGIGEYTAAAISTIAFGRKAPVVDANIERVISRLLALTTPLPQSKPAIKTAVSTLMPEARPGDFAQGLMDLASAVCRPRAPACLACPLGHLCAGHHQGIAASLPHKAAKKARPVRFGHVLWLENLTGAVLVERRPQTGLLAGMIGFPGSAWEENPPPPVLPAGVDWHPALHPVRHVFTHFALELSIFKGIEKKPIVLAEHQSWVHPDAFPSLALPSVMKKVWQAAR